MSTKSIQIQPNPHSTPTQPAVFAPAAVVANAGDNLTWYNADQQAHWPAPSAADRAAWIQFQIPPGGSSRGDVALAKNAFAVTAATNASPVVLTFNGPAPATGATVSVTYGAPKGGATPWKGVSGTFVATMASPNSCSIPVDSSGFGPFTSASGTLTIALPYTLTYVCALHPAEAGTIAVNPQA
jgi:hypothetical protein